MKRDAKKMRPAVQQLRPLASILSSVALTFCLATTSAPVLASSLPPLTGIPTEFRSIDGTGNNTTFSDWGSANSPLMRLGDVSYGDGISTMAGAGRPAPRQISNALGDQTAPMPNPQGLSAYFWSFGQLLDHDLDLTFTNPSEPANMIIGAGDPDYPSGTMIPFNRSVGVGDPGNPRQQINAITSYIDASFVYGSDPTTASTLRVNDGSGRLATSAGGLLPTNGQLGLSGNPDLRVAGDIRVNENAGLTSLQTIFVREHNRLADAIQAANPALSGDDTYHFARELVAGQMQAITYNEFLPILLGSTSGLGGYGGYDNSVDASIANEFSGALYRFGHSMVQEEFIYLEPDLSTTARPVFECLFEPTCIQTSEDVDGFLGGLRLQHSETLDGKIVDSLRNMLFTDFGMMGIDLMSINLQRGRDHGLPGYLDFREDIGLGSIALSAELLAAYGGSDDVDLLIAALMETPFGDALVGETMHWVFLDQFERLRAGDRFWYENEDNNLFDPLVIDWLNQQTLRDVILRNSDARLAAGSVFFVADIPAPVPLALAVPALIWLLRRRNG